MPKYRLEGDTQWRCSPRVDCLQLPLRPPVLPEWPYAPPRSLRISTEEGGSRSCEVCIRELRPSSRHDVCLSQAHGRPLA